MTELLQPTLPEIPAEVRLPTGVLPAQVLRQLINRTDGKREIFATSPKEQPGEDQIQPASLDLRLGEEACRVRAGFLPGERATVEERLEGLVMHRLSLAEEAVLEKGCVYIVRLLEELSLSKEHYGLANPKSSIGRIDVFTRLITDQSTEFDHIRAGYAGPLYAEISSLAFSIVVRKGTRLNQLRLKRGTPRKGKEELEKFHQTLRETGAGGEVADTYRRGFPITVETRGDSTAGLIGYRAKKHAPLLNLSKVDFYEQSDYWEPVYGSRNGELILNPGDFYLLASKEPIVVPPDHAAEMVAYDTLVGELRVHYAGFFDPGFGHADSGGAGTRAVLEVRSHEVPFVIEDGQILGRLMYERLADVPDKLYGSGIGSSYQRQGLALSKHFKKPV